MLRMNIILIACGVVFMRTNADLLQRFLQTMEELVSSLNTDRTIRYKFDPQADMTTLEIIHYNGYPGERHEVATKDGYILELHRIPRGRYNGTKNGRRPILLLHGISTSSSIWVINGERDSAGFIFADEGYDVWLGNIRGNTYSRRHVTIDPTESRFWEFTLDDHATLDIPAMIDYILEVTSHQKLTYVGVSLGGTTGTMLLAEKPEYNNKIDLAIFFSPVLNTTFIRNVFKLLQYHFPEANEWFSIFSTKEIMSQNKLVNKFLQSMCLFYPGVIFCELVAAILFGYNEALLDRNRGHAFLPHGMCGTSWKIIEHFVQIGNADKIQKFDYGPDVNLKYYGQMKPPRYNFSQISTPTAIFWGYMDLFMDQKHVDILPSQFPNLIVIEKVPYETWSHADFISALNARFHFYDRLLRFLKEMHS